MKVFLLILLFIPSICSAEYLTATPEQCKCLEENTGLELSYNPKYVWGGLDKAGWSEKDLEIGAPGDCSGKLTAIFQRCGFLVGRVTAKMMAEGQGGWVLVKYKLPDGRKLMLVFFTLPPKPGQPVRINGHVGILIEDVEEESAYFAHASLSRGFNTSLLEPGSYWSKYMTFLRGFQK